VFEIGLSLRQARERHGLDLADVERETRIRAKYLNALEDEQFDVLPGAAYVRGFLRTYAEFLGLDGNLLVEEYNERVAPPEDELLPIQPSGLERAGRRLAHPVLGLTLAALASGLVLVWQLGFTSAKRTPIPPAANAAVPRVHRPAAKAKAQPKPHVAAAPKPALLVVHAVRGPCWVAVRIGDRNGRVVYEQVVATGGTVRFGLKQALWVRLGAPWNADVILRGKQLAAFPPRQPVNLRAV
jgi:cytoskeletal protein RodZ